MLHEGGESNDRVVAGALQHQRGVGDTEISPPREHFLDRVNVRTALANANLKSRVTVVALLYCRIEGGKLELMPPVELNSDEGPIFRLGCPASQDLTLMAHADQNKKAYQERSGQRLRSVQPILSY